MDFWPDEAVQTSETVWLHQNMILNKQNHNFSASQVSKKRDRGRSRIVPIPSLYFWYFIINYFKKRSFAYIQMVLCKLLILLWLATEKKVVSCSLCYTTKYILILKEICCIFSGPERSTCIIRTAGFVFRILLLQKNIRHLYFKYCEVWVLTDEIQILLRCSIFSLLKNTFQKYFAHPCPVWFVASWARSLRWRMLRVVWRDLWRR